LREFCVIHAESPRGFAFGDCVFDPEARTLKRAGRTVALSPKAFALLATLLETNE
jgi:DNA-binding winged helix-turn-helix (wHTH) protein